ncbi:hypothetical protein ACI3EY_13865 [Ornithinimicrobium sp. LYQ92]|uniref:hypothetical protein n=1 Tax=Serinicoccus sp. LYQ92 TaxID=3378798 RepID=UPI003853AD17
MSLADPPRGPAADSPGAPGARGAPGGRVRVTSSRRGATTARPRPLADSLVQQTGAGELYLRGLLRAQLRLALEVLGVLVLVLGGLPLLYAFVPAVREASWAGVPLAWPLLAVGLYPVMVLLALRYTGRATRLESRLSAAARER